MGLRGSFIYDRGKDVMGDFDTENVAVATVTKLISKTGFLVPLINAMDREPSLDGKIIVYGHKGRNHEKDDILGYVNVQVKGYELKAPELAVSNYSLDVSDLKNFLKVGGAILLVVTTDNEGEHEKVYYSRLLPYELKKLLKECKENQKTKSVPIVELPTDKNEVSDIFTNFVRNYEEQRAYINSDFELDGRKVKKEDFNELSFGFTSVQNKKNYYNPIEYLFNHGTYLYANIGHGVKMPIEYIEKIDIAFANEKGKIGVGKDIFYGDYKRVLRKDYTELQIGESHKISIYPNEEKVKYNYKLSGTLKQRIVAEKMMLKIIEEGYITVNGINIPLNMKNAESKCNMNAVDMKKHIDWLEKVARALEISRCTEDLDCNNLTQKDDINIRLLVDGLIEKKQLALNAKESTFGTITIGNLCIMICALQRLDNMKFELFPYYEAPIIMNGIAENGSEFESSYYLMLTKEEILKASNIDLEYIIGELSKIEINDNYISSVIYLLLEIIGAYDISLDIKLLNASENLCNWLSENDPVKNNVVHIINALQLKKRKQNLSKNDVAKLKKINKETLDPVVKTGTYILLEDFESAKLSYKDIPLDKRAEFKNYPICKFCIDIDSEVKRFSKWQN